jgi:hypothetical protein
MLADMSDHSPLAIAEKLAGMPVCDVMLVGGGRNSRVYRIDTGSGSFALKQYPSREDDPRDRLGVEAAALTVMRENGIDVVPRVVAIDTENNFILLSWEAGTLVRKVSTADIDQAARFIESLHALRGKANFPVTHLAAEACLSGSEIERQLRARLAALGSFSDEAALQGFLGAECRPFLDHALAAAHERMGDGAFGAELPPERRSLVPADFGFHNALRDSDGTLTFIDFEYFGWDDPVKLTADVMLHPGTDVSPDLRERFCAAALAIYGEDAGFARRLKAFHPLFGLRWVLIMLNEFYPERWRRRLLAGETEGWEQAKKRQLGKARAMLSMLAAQGTIG